LRTKLDLRIDFSLSFTLIISQFIQEKCPIDFFDYFIIFFQDILIILLLFFPKYFDYFIIILLFWFNRGYSMNDWLDFVLIVIKRDYNTNYQLKFIIIY